MVLLWDDAKSILGHLSIFHSRGLCHHWHWADNSWFFLRDKAKRQKALWVHFSVLKTIKPIKKLSVETKLNYFYFTLERLQGFEDASQFFPSPVFECHKLLGKKIDIYLSSLCVHYLHLTDCHQTALIYDTLLHTFLVCWGSITPSVHTLAAACSALVVLSSFCLIFSCNDSSSPDCDMAVCR